MKKARHRKNAKSYIRVIALFLCALIFSSCTNCASCNFADLFYIEIIPNASEKESASGIEGELNEEKNTHTHSQTPTEKHTELPTEEPTEPVPEWNEDIKSEVQNAYRRINPKAEYPEAQFLGQFDDAYAVYVLDTGSYGHLGAYFVEGYEFRYNAPNQVYLYRNGEFIAMTDALEKNMITSADVASIQENFKFLNPQNYKYVYIHNENLPIDLGRASIELQPSYNFKEYTTEDFSAIGCTKLEEVETLVEYSANEIYRGFIVYFDADTIEETLRKIKILESREDVYRVSSCGPMFTDSLTNDAEYGNISS